MKVENDIASTYIAPAWTSTTVICRKVKAPLAMIRVSEYPTAFDQISDTSDLEFYYTSGTSSFPKITYSDGTEATPGNYFGCSQVSSNQIVYYHIIPRTYLNLFEVHPVSIASNTPVVKCVH